jgi:hypothetical protein
MKRIANISLMTVAFFLSSVILLGANITLIKPIEGVTISQHNSLQKKYLEMSMAERISYFANYKTRTEMKSAGHYPLPVEFAWKWNGTGKACFTVFLCTSPDFKSCITTKTNKCSATMTNLMINQKYYWKISAVNNGEKTNSEVSTFVTEDSAPRLMQVDGVPNVRDLGGRKAMNGKRVKQNLVFRTAGLNSNARTLYYKQSELEKLPCYKTLAEENSSRQKNIQQLEQCLKNPKDIKVLPYKLDSIWTVFRPDSKKFKDADFFTKAAQLKKIPKDHFMGAEPEMLTMDKNGNFKFKTPQENAPSIFMQEFDSSEDGFMQVGCGADWFWCFYINGKQVYNIMDGNNKNPVSVKNHQLQIPVQKGQNLIAVLVRSGSAGWQWSCGSLPEGISNQKILTDNIHNQKKALKNLLRVEKGYKPGHTRLNVAMKKYMLEDLGIKSEIDLRSDYECRGMTSSPLGPTVTWFHYSSDSYGGMQNKNGKEAFTKVFKVFLDRKNYPIVFHCSAGQDRTGSVAFILNGLLGVSLNELYLDWETTGFWNSGLDFCHSTRFNSLIKGFETLPGKTMQHKIENYILGLGFSKQDIEKFRAIMLE